MGAEALRQLSSNWFAEGRYDTQSLAVVLEEVLDSKRLAPLARAQSILRFCDIREDYLLLPRIEMLGQEAASQLRERAQLST